jgi:hypothetical protein
VPLNVNFIKDHLKWLISVVLQLSRLSICPCLQQLDYNLSQCGFVFCYFLGTCWTWTCMFMSSTKFRKFLFTVSSCILLPYPLLYLSRIAIILMSVHLIMPQRSQSLFTLLSVFSSLSNWIMLIYLSLRLRILSLKCSDMLLNHSSEITLR